MVLAMDTIKASEFKAKCLQLMDEVARTGDSITITKNGKPVAQLIPAATTVSSLAGLHKGRIEICGDIVSPVENEWEAQGDLTGYSRPDMA